MHVEANAACFPLGVLEINISSMSERDGPGIEKTSGKRLGRPKGFPTLIGRAAVFEEYVSTGGDRGAEGLTCIRRL